LPAAKVAQVPILRHGFRVLAAKNQLHQQNQMKKMLDSGWGGKEKRIERTTHHHPDGAGMSNTAQHDSL
jgi:hypothetical protein